MWPLGPRLDQTLKLQFDNRSMLSGWLAYAHPKISKHIWSPIRYVCAISYCPLFNRIVCMNYGCSCSCSLMCCRLSHYSLGITLLCYSFSLCSVLQSYVSCLLISLGTMYAVATVLYDQLSVAFNQSQLLLLSPPR